VAVVLTLVQTKHKRNNTKKHSTNNTKHSKYKYTYYQNTHTLRNPYTHAHTHAHLRITKQVTTTTVEVKTNTVQDIPKWSGHNTIKYPQYKVTLMNMAILYPRTSP